MSMYKPDNRDWKNLGPATCRRWPMGIPSLEIRPEGSYFYKEHLGDVWVLFIAEITTV